MTLFSSEEEMQKWLSSALDNSNGLAELIVNFDAVNEATANTFAESRLLQSFKTCISSLYITEKVSENENISISKDGILKPDFVLYATETESIIIVELKNIAGPTRQAGTELAAYGSEIRASVPFIADGDIVNVIVSTEWPTLLRHYVRHEIFWQRKNLLCLRPVTLKGEIKLEILGLSEFAEDVTSFKIGHEYLGGYQICLYDRGFYSSNPDRSRLDCHVEQFKAALHSMATTGNKANSHGFAFLWKDQWQESLAPYSITVLNFAPFQSVERFLHLGDGELPDMIKRFMCLVKEYDPQGHGNSLRAITDAGNDLLNHVCSPAPEGFTHWGTLRSIMNTRAQHIAFVGWGLFGEAFLEKLKSEYKSGNTDCSLTSPSLGLAVVSEIVDDNYQFIDLSYIDFDCLNRKSRQG